MKDELGGKIMTEFIVLRVKMYAYRNIDKKVKDKHCKGTKKCIVTESLTFDNYKACLFDGKTIYRQKMLFENKKHVATDHRVSNFLFSLHISFLSSFFTILFPTYLYKNVFSRKILPEISLLYYKTKIYCFYLYEKFKVHI